MHAQRLKVHGDVGGAESTLIQTTTCGADGCERDRRPGRRWCSMHAARLARTGSLGTLNPDAPHHLSEPGERWARLPGYEDYFWVSSIGRVYAAPRRTTAGRIRRPGVEVKSGYLSHRLLGKTFRVHVLVALAFIGPRPDGMVVRHLDDDPSNNTVENLAYGTRQDNADDAVRNRLTVGVRTRRGMAHRGCAEGEQ